MRTAALLFVLVAAGTAQERISPPGAPQGAPLSQGIRTDKLVYVSGQGARDAKGQLAADFDAQARQTLENVRAVLQAAGVDMQHVVYAQVYLADMSKYEAFNRVYAKYFQVYAKYFQKDPPARSTIGVARMPGGTPIEVSAVAVRDLKDRKAIAYPGRTMSVPVSPAVQAGNRVYLTGGLGRVFETGEVPKDPAAQVKLVMDQSETVLKAAGLEMRHLVYAIIFVSPQMPLPLLAKAIDEYVPDEAAKTVVQTASLPYGVNLQITGVASREIKRLGKCTGVSDTIYCSGRAGTIRQALETLKADLEANGTSIDKTVSATVYLDDMDEFAAMNKVYASFFGQTPPTRTTVQPWKRVAELSLPPATGITEDKSPRAQVTLIAIRP